MNEHPPFESDLQYVQEELLWLEARATRIGAESALDRLEEDKPRRRYDSEDLSPRVLHRRSRRAAEVEVERRATLDARLAAHRASDAPPLALDVLCERCGLDDFDRTVVLLAAAPCFSASYEELFGRVTGADSMDFLSVEGVFAFHELSLAERIEQRGRFSARAPLAAQDLVTINTSHRWTGAKDLLGSELEITRRTFAFLVGRNELNEEFMEFSSVEEPRARLDQVVLDEADKGRILSVVERHQRYLEARRDWGFDDCIGYGRGTMMLFHGPSGTGKTMTAHGIAAHLGKRVLNVDIPTFLGGSEANRFLPGLFREARLQDALLFFDECEALFASRSRHNNALMTLLLTELERFEGVAVLATNLPNHLDEALARRILVRVGFRRPDRLQRAEIWRRHLPSGAPLADDLNIEELATRYELTGGLIKNAVLTAVAAAVHDGGDAPRIRQDHLEDAAEAQLPRMDADGEPVTVPTARLRDVVLRPKARRAIDDLLSTVRHRPLVLERWSIGGPRTDAQGVAALFHGPPGTGKTLCAEALAGELNRPLRVGRAPSLLSKWVGETERNLDALFRRARAERAVLLLDEADSLVGRRGNSGTSRHDLSMTNVLLDRIERHPGLVLLATNLPDQLDPALERRLAFRIAFEPPGRDQRLEIWQRMLPKEAPVAEDLDLDSLAVLDLTGAAIRAAVLRAATRAAESGGTIDQAALTEAAHGFMPMSRRAVGF